MTKNKVNPVKFDLDYYFEKLRFDNRFHLGLGDIRLTLAMQDDLVNIFRQLEKRILELENESK